MDYLVAFGWVVGRTGWGSGQALGAKSGIIFISLVMAHGPGLMMPSVPQPRPPASSQSGRPQGSLWNTWGRRRGVRILFWTDTGLPPILLAEGQRLYGRFA